MYYRERSFLCGFINREIFIKMQILQKVKILSIPVIITISSRIGPKILFNEKKKKKKKKKK